MAPAKEVEKAEKERDSCQRTITWLEKKLAEHATTPIIEVKVDQFIETVTKSKEKVEDTFNRIVQNCDPVDLDPHSAEYESLMDRVTELMCDFLTIKNSFPPPATTGTSSSTARGGPAPTTDIRLPRLNLPVFDGRIEDWTSFRDMFVSAIHGNGSISKTQKLTYLKSQLRGEAARLIQSLVISETNYDIAWKLLEDRYQNDRQLLFALLSRLFNQNSITSPTSENIRYMLDVSSECMRSLEVIHQPVKHWDSVILFILYQKLDKQSRELFEQTLPDSKVPTLQNLLKFVEQRSRALEASDIKVTQPNRKPVENPRQQAGPQRNNVHHAQQNNPSNPCMVCKQSFHLLYKCSGFLAMSIPDRADIIKKQNHCYNCLRSGHNVAQCQSTSTCRECNGKHHSLLHRNRATEKSTPAEVSGKPPTLTHHSNVLNTVSQTLLATAIVHIRDSQGINIPVRVLLDGGSDSHIITKEAIQRLGLPWTKKQALVTGLSQVPVGTTQGIIDLEFSPHFDSSIIIQAKATSIMAAITARLPLHPCNSELPHVRGLQLADESWYVPGEIDMLVGASIFYEIISGEKMTGSIGEPFALNSDVGWLVVGEEQKSRVTVSDVDLDQRLARMWELESFPDTQTLSQEEKDCEEHFVSTHSQQSDGRFMVHLPFKSFPPEVASNRDMAVQKLKQLERRLARDPEVRKEYLDFMNEYLSMGHMEEVPADEVNVSETYYIPHHYVKKEESTTTKLRVVFDASSKTRTGKSLNDCLLVGPTIQDPLLNIILRFRTYPVAFTADIAKMYRQILVKKSHTDYQRILWRPDPSLPIKDFRLLTVTYGTSSAPFHAVRILQQLAKLNALEFPLASKVALNDFYVDDCMSGAETVSEALILQKELLSLMERGRFELRKWSSTHSAVLEALPTDLRESKSVLPVELGHTVKTLGIYWQPEEDHFFFKIDSSTDDIVKRALTKRTILSDIAKIFDPTGWLAPIVVPAKIMMQTLWKLDLGWDEPVPEAIQIAWRQYKFNLKSIESIRIPRCIKPTLNSDSQLALIGFSDASEKAYAAMVYLVVYSSSSKPVVSLVTSKTRVAPTKTVSLPRLELCGAELLASVFEYTQRALGLSYQHVSAWTDSTTTFDWIQSSPSRWQRFVANRVTKIQEIVKPSLWGHVAGVDNPADCASRGLDPQDLSTFSLWWNGPSWLQNGIPAIVKPNSASNTEVTLEERKEIIGLKTQVHASLFVLDNYSSLTKLQRVTAWAFRFINNSRAKYSLAQQQECRPVEETGVGPLSSGCGLATNRQFTRSSGPLLPEELKKAMEYWVRSIQHESFSEVKTLSDSSNPHIDRKSPILSLKPYIDPKGLLRVGGRIRHAPVGFEQRHPVLLPRNHNFTRLIIEYEHKKHLHAGPQALLSVIQSQYWIIRGRDAIRQCIRKCLPCTKQRAITMQQVMADLPKFRVTPARAFSKCGVDYAGPFQLKPMVPRSKSVIKSYLCLFVCCVTRALHLELVSSLSTDAFLAAFRRFIARRGKPDQMYSDCGTNFVGASKELRKLCSNNIHNQEISDQLSHEGILWNFNPPAAPHFGGLWEAGVKSVKFHLYRVMGPTRLNFEEMSTTLCQIEAVLNSRPLVPESADPSDLSALTPGHFLIGAPLTAAPDSDVTHLNPGRLNRWQLLQQMYQSFWKRWSNEYLTRLQQRPKWMMEQPDIQIGDLVTVKEENLPPMTWRLGRVEEIFPGRDGLVRVVKLKTQNGFLTRPITKLCLLPVPKTNDIN